MREIVRYVKPRRVGAGDPWIAGLISLRSRLVLVCDLGQRLGRGPHSGEDAKIVVIDLDGNTAGVIVDDVTGVLTVEPERLEAIPGGTDELMQAIAQIGGRLVVVVDPERLLRDLA